MEGSGTMRRSGFSLVELLVVIAVIVILMALLIPAIGMARAHARSKQCASNQVQIFHAWTRANSRDSRQPVRGPQWTTRLSTSVRIRSWSSRRMVSSREKGARRLEHKVGESRPERKKSSRSRRPESPERQDFMARRRKGTAFPNGPAHGSLIGPIRSIFLDPTPRPDGVGGTRMRNRSLLVAVSLGAAMLMTPGTEPCSRADAERLFEVAEEPVEIGVGRVEASLTGGQPQ